MNFVQSVKSAASVTWSYVKLQSEKVVVAVTGATAAVFGSSSPSHAAGDVDDLFAAFNITGLQSNIKVVLLAGVVIMTLFVGYRFLNKAGNKM